MRAEQNSTIKVQIKREYPAFSDSHRSSRHHGRLACERLRRMTDPADVASILVFLVHVPAATVGPIVGVDDNVERLG